MVPSLILSVLSTPLNLNFTARRDFKVPPPYSNVSSFTVLLSTYRVPRVPTSLQGTKRKHPTEPRPRVRLTEYQSHCIGLPGLLFTKSGTRLGCLPLPLAGVLLLRRWTPPFQEGLIDSPSGRKSRQ